MVDFEPELRQFLTEVFLFGEDRPLRSDESLLDSGILDSTGILELIAHLEKRYGIKVNDEELIPENLDTIANIGIFLNIKLA